MNFHHLENLHESISWGCSHSSKHHAHQNTPHIPSVRTSAWPLGSQLSEVSMSSRKVTTHPWRPLPYERIPGFFCLLVKVSWGVHSKGVFKQPSTFIYIYTVLYIYICIFQQSGKNTNLLKPKATLWIIDLQALKQSKHFYPGSPS